MDVELKPCPFCGGEAKIFVFEKDEGYEANIYCMSDGFVGCFTRQFHWALKKDWVIETAIKSWNKRVEV